MFISIDLGDDILESSSSAQKELLFDSDAKVNKSQTVRKSH